DRMLSVLPHVELFVPGAAPEEVLEHWQDIAKQAEANPSVRGAAPFVAAQAMLVRGEALSGVQLRGIDPKGEAAVSDVRNQMIDGSLDVLQPGSYTVVLGLELAHALGVRTGDTLLVLAPQGS